MKCANNRAGAAECFGAGATGSKEMKHIVQLSGGKDSTAMLLMMLERNMPVDEIIFCDTGMELPPMNLKGTLTLQKIPSIRSLIGE